MQFFGPFGFIFSPLGLFLDQDQVQNTLLEPTNLDYQFWFWKCSPIFLFLIWPNLGPFLALLGPSGLFYLPFMAIFWVEIRFKTNFGSLLI